MKEKVSESILVRRFKKFKTIKRGYYSLIILSTLYIISFFNPFLINNRALVVSYNDKIYIPAFKFYSENFFNQSENKYAEANYRKLKKTLQENKTGFVLMPIYPYSPTEILLSELKGFPPTKPDGTHILGTDITGRDVFARLCYAFNISITYSLSVTGFSIIIGVLIGSMFGYFGGILDIFGQRLVEIFSAIPFLYTLMTINSFIKPSNTLQGIITLATLNVFLGGWLSTAAFMRGEFLREKRKDYVSAMYAIGGKNSRIMYKHIFPNAVNPIITMFPFMVLGNIFGLVALDYLGYGLPPPTPSWGELLNQGYQDISKWWLISSPAVAQFLTLIAINFIGEAIREAFDPKQYSRIR